jgi:hypothetical protein
MSSYPKQRQQSYQRSLAKPGDIYMVRIGGLVLYTEPIPYLFDSGTAIFKIPS